MIEAVVIAQLQARPTLDPINPARIITPPAVETDNRYRLDTRTRILPDVNIKTDTNEEKSNTKTNTELKLEL